MPGSRRLRLLLVAAACGPSCLAAQPGPNTRSPANLYAEYETGGELERYLRSLQALGGAAVYPWSLRGFSPHEVDRLRGTPAGHPWAPRLSAAADAGSVPRLVVTRPSTSVSYNSAFPFGGNDGAVWAGRGVTASLGAGGAFRWGALSIAAQPIVFWAQNQAFPLLDNGLEGVLRYADGQYPTRVDRPQRFGDGAYARLDPGQSTVRLDAFGAAVGFSTANMWWGPAQEYPFLLGTNAAGFPHVFGGTARPANLWLAHVQARVIWGSLAQSEYFDPATDPAGITRARRFGTGLALVVTPRALDNLELGAARFYHAAWPDGGLPRRYYTRVFEGLLKKGLPTVDNPIAEDDRSSDGENQLASVFARLVLPGTGFEVYTEFGREDHAWDIRDLVLTPDDRSSLMVGFRKSWRAGVDGSAMRVLRGEFIDFTWSQIDSRRGSPAIYLHSAGSNQGHTERGQLLGADIGVGSSAAGMLGVDLYDRRGRTTVEWRRVLRQEQGPLLLAATDPGSEAGLDVMHTLSGERLLFRGRTDYAVGVDLTYDFNRDFARDRTNVSVRFSMSGLPQ